MDTHGTEYYTMGAPKSQFKLSVWLQRLPQIVPHSSFQNCVPLGTYQVPCSVLNILFTYSIQKWIVAHCSMDHLFLDVSQSSHL